MAGVIFFFLTIFLFPLCLHIKVSAALLLKGHQLLSAALSLERSMSAQACSRDYRGRRNK